jgi:hypothetical protein
LERIFCPESFPAFIGAENEREYLLSARRRGTLYPYLSVSAKVFFIGVAARTVTIEYGCTI